jgi:hypothetical protein
LADLPAVRKRKANYYGTFADTLAEKATLVGSAPLTGEERDLLRPDLPFAIAQRADLSWANDWDALTDVTGDTLHTAQVYVIPFGPAGGSKRAVRLVADDGIAFTAPELLGKAQHLQRPLLGKRSLVEGVGLYRNGLIRGVPAYYVWGAQSQLHTYVAEYEAGWRQADRDRREHLKRDFRRLRENQDRTPPDAGR